MIRCSVEDLLPEMVLGKSLFDDQGKLLLAAGHRLDDEFIAAIRKRGFQSVLIYKEGTEEIIPEDIISEKLRIACNNVVQNGFGEISERAKAHLPKPGANLSRVLRESTEFDEIIQVKELTPQIKDIVEEILALDPTVKLSGILRSVSAHQSQHAVEVMIISLKLGVAFGYDHNELRQMGTAALFHDIGFGIIPEIVNKPENKRRLDEKILYKEHPVFGSILLDKSSEGLYVEQTSILQHHEQQNGRGYPLKKRGENQPPTLHRKNGMDYIFRHAEIISAANVYDNFVSAAPGKKQLPPLEALEGVRKLSRTALNEYVVEELDKLIDVYPPGCLVMVENCSDDRFVGFTGAVKKYRRAPERLEIVLILDDEGVEMEPDFQVFLADPKLRIRMVL